MGTWDFTADSDKQKKISEIMIADSEKFVEHTGKMYESINRMEAFWEGDAQKTFHDSTYAYKNAIDDLGKSIAMYGKHFELMVPGTEELASSIITILEDLTGAGGNPANNPTGDPDYKPEYEEETEETEETKKSGESEKETDEESGKKVEEEETKSTLKTDEEESGEEKKSVLSSERTRHELTSGTPVTINDQDYNVYGFITGKDGKSQAIYVGQDNKLYYFDENLERKEVLVKYGDPVFRNFRETDLYQPTKPATIDPYGKIKTDSDALMWEGRPYALSIDGVEFQPEEIFKHGYAYEDLSIREYGSYGAYDTPGHREFKEDNVFKQIEESNTEEFRTVEEREYTDLEKARNGETVHVADHTGEQTVAVPGNAKSFADAVRAGQVIKITDRHSLRTPDGTIIGFNEPLDLSKFKVFGKPIFPEGSLPNNVFVPRYLVLKGNNYYLADKYGNVLESEKYSFPRHTFTLDSFDFIGENFK